jgi:hypothetical protein
VTLPKGPSSSPPGSRCARDNRTLCLIDIRLSALQDTVYDANDSLGRLYSPIQFRLQQSGECIGHATALCDGRLAADENRARKKLQRCLRSLAIVRAKIRSRYARRKIPPDLAAAVASEADGIASDLEAARTSLTCP